MTQYSSCKSVLYLAISAGMYIETCAGRRMASLSLLGLCVLSLTQGAAGLLSSDRSVMFALVGDTVVLPCGIPSVKSCMSINWNMAGAFGSVTEVVKAGVVTAANERRLLLLKDCSLQITHLVNDDARVYTCGSGSLHSNVTLQLLQLTESPTAERTIELHCFLNMYKGLVSCIDRDVHIKWSSEDDTPINGSRFHIHNPSPCFSKLTIEKKLTDHHRKWKCQLSESDTVKATISYTTTVKDGIEEVVAAVGESVSFSCNNTSSRASGGGVQWTVSGRSLAGEVAPQKAFHVNKDSSLVISKVSASYSTDYECSESTGEQKVLNNIRLHTVDVVSKYGPGGINLTLTCVLTCAQECEKDFSVTWCGGSQQGWRSTLMMANNTFTVLFIPAPQMRSLEIACCVKREGAVVMSKTWRSVNPLQTLAWLALPLGLLVCAAAGGLYMCMKRKHNKDPGTEPSRIEMMHDYEIIQDQLRPERQSRREAPSTDSFYDLLQAVN